MNAVHTTSATTNEDTNKSTSTRVSAFTRECSSCHVAFVTNPYSDSTRFQLKPGENMFDFEGSTASTQHLSSFLHLLSASNVYRMFFAYTQVLQHDSHRCCTSYQKYGEHNRFNDIPCIEESRVHVKYKSEEHDYIHASWVDGYREPKKFILTQAPLKHTIDKFWHMIWQEKCLVVVCMIQMFDVNGAEWSVSYIPKRTGEKRNVGDILLVHCGTRCIRQTYDATLIKVTRNGSERQLLHLCYFAWGHRGTPRKPTEVINFISDINFNRELLVKKAVADGWLKSNENSPVVVHCLTGTSRSATLVALDICFRKLDDTAKRPCGPLADVEDVVLRLRTQRAMAIQKVEQYLFLHLAVTEYAVHQRYISDKTYSEINLEGFFYEPLQQKDDTEAPSRGIRSRNIGTETFSRKEKQNGNHQLSEKEKDDNINKNPNSSQ